MQWASGPHWGWTSADPEQGAYLTERVAQERVASVAALQAEVLATKTSREIVTSI